MEKNVSNWFELPAKDLSRAKSFYSKLLGVAMQDMPMPGMEMAAFPWIHGGEFSTGAIVKSEGYEPGATGAVIYFVCQDVNNQLEKVAGLGVEILIPKTAIGEHGFFAHIIDSEGNRIGLHSIK